MYTLDQLTEIVAAAYHQGVVDDSGRPPSEDKVQEYLSSEDVRENIAGTLEAFLEGQSIEAQMRLKDQLDKALDV